MAMAPKPFGGAAPWLKNNSDMLLSAGLGLLSGATPSEQFANAAKNIANERRYGQMNNKTIEYLRQNNPDLAMAVENGIMPAGEAFKAAFASKTKKAPLEVNGRLVDPDTYKVVADFSTPKAPSYDFKTLPDGTYGNYDQTSGSFEPLGKAPKPTREDAQPLTATDKKALWSAEDEIPMLDNTLASLKQARELNRKTYTGTGAGLLGTIGTNVPGADFILDREKAVATSEFNKLMSMEAIQSMAQSLKGATTDSELARFVDILADPSTDPDIRERTIDRMMSLAERVREVKASRINELRGISAPAGAGATGNRTATGATWSVVE